MKLVTGLSNLRLPFEENRMSKPVITVFWRHRRAGRQPGAGAAQRRRTALRRPRGGRASPTAPRARQLAKAGAEVVLADLDDGAQRAARPRRRLRRLLCDELLGAPVTRRRNWRRPIGWPLRPPRRYPPRHLVHARGTHATSSRPRVHACRCLRDVSTCRITTPRARRTRYFAQQRVPVTYLYTSCFWENLIRFGMGPERRWDGSLVVTFPFGGARIPWIGVEDVGYRGPRDFLAWRRAGL